MSRSRFKTEKAYKKSLKHSAECNKSRRAAEKKVGKAALKGKHLSHTKGGGAKIEDAKTNMKRSKKGSGRLADGKGTYKTKLRSKAGRPPSKSKSKKK